MKIQELITKMSEGYLDAALTTLYGEENVSAQRARYTEAVKEFAAIYGEDRNVNLFSVPGRSEISGNHTDHNRGCVIAAAIDLDIIAVASMSGNDTVRVKSKGFPEDVVTCNPEKPDEALFNSSSSLISGVCAGFKNRGYNVCGFDAYTTSNVLKGSGISSSAAFEVMIGNILNYFVNDGKTVDELSLSSMVGLAFVADCEGILSANDARAILAPVREKSEEAAKRLLLKGKVTVSLDAARVFAEAGVLLLGNESQTVGPQEAPMAVHLTLLSADVVLLEGIRLAEVSEGVYFLNAAPLNLSGADGAPCRALLIADKE